MVLPLSEDALKYEGSRELSLHRPLAALLTPIKGVNHKGKCQEGFMIQPSKEEIIEALIRLQNEEELTDREIWILKEFE